jgi:hypothetical protein
MLPGDELVADYLAGAGRSAAALLPPVDCASVVEEVGRRVRAQVGAPPRWDRRGTEAKLAELGSPEDLVLAVTEEIAPHALPQPEPEPEPEPELPPVMVLGTDLTPEALENPTLDLGAVQRPVLPSQSQARVSETAGGPRRFPPLSDDDPPPWVRPLAADEPVPRDTLSGLNRLGWEVVALAVLGLGVFVMGYLAWLLGAVLVTRSRYWEISDKVRVLIGLPAAGLGLALAWAWLRSTQIQESNDSSTRLSEAGHSLAHSVSTFPQLFGVLGALYLAYALVRDHHAG